MADYSWFSTLRCFLDNDFLVDGRIVNPKIHKTFSPSIIAAIIDGEKNFSFLSSSSRFTIKY